MDFGHALLLFVILLMAGFSDCWRRAAKGDRNKRDEWMQYANKLEADNRELNDKYFAWIRNLAAEYRSRLEECHAERDVSVAAFLAQPWGPMAPVCQ